MNSIPQELNTIERNMYRALSNHPEENIELCWKRGQTKNRRYVLVGCKKTNSRNGEAKFSFETQSLPLGADIRSLLPPKEEKESEQNEEAIALSAAKNILQKKLTRIDEEIEGLQRQKDALYIVLKNNF